MRHALLVGMVLATLSCSRQVVVENAPRPIPETSLSVTNRLTQSVNVYVVVGGSDSFLKQVAANTTDVIPVPAIPAGTTVQLKARTADGTRTYTRDNVVLRDTVAWEIR
jgi:hypothetical protein